MKIDRLVKDLEAYEALYAHSDCPENAQILQVFLGTLSGQEEKTVISLVNHILKYWKSVERTPCHPELLKKVLTAIETVHRQLESIGLASAYEKLLTLFCGEGDLNIAVFAGDLMQAVSANPSTPVMKPCDIDQDRIADFVERLKRRIDDTDRFWIILEELLTQGNVSKMELDLIAGQLIGNKTGFETKGEAVEALRVWQLHAAIQKI